MTQKRLIYVEAKVEPFLVVILKLKGESFMCALCNLDKPASYEKALNSHTSNKWLVAMREEMSYILNNQVWKLVDLILGCNSIRNKWILKIKHLVDGSIDKYKAIPKEKI